MRIQSKTLPENWLELVKEFNIHKSKLSENNKIIATYLVPMILSEKEKSLNNKLLRILIRFIIFQIDFLGYYDNLPQKLIKNAFDEIKNERGSDLVRRLHSLFVEFITYQDLYKQGYRITEFTREQGSCDLIMNKNNEIYNFEVKFKESEDIGKSRLYDYIDGCSLLKGNEFLKGKTFEINLKVDSLNYSNLQAILDEIDKFVSKKEDSYDGEKLQIFDSKKRNQLNRDFNQSSQDLNNCYMQVIEDIDTLINKIFIENNGHLTKLIGKSKKYEFKDNFTGCLVWAIPSYMDIDNNKIEQAFKKISLDFDLFVYVKKVCVDEEEFCFFIPKKKKDI